MKKILFGIFILLLSACNNEEIAESQKAEGDNVALTLSVNVPELVSVGRALGETATIDNLTLFVFDEKGYFLYKSDATALPQTGNDEKEFTVVLRQTSVGRIIHFVANHTVDAVDFEPEQTMMSRMAVGNNQDAYWQRIVFKNGISENTEIKKVPLIRNFAKISVTSQDANFKIISYAVGNTPNMGTVTPYIGGKEEFLDFKEATTYTAIKEQGYAGFMPDEVEINGEPSAEVNGGAPIYMYERRQPNDETATYILLYGEYEGTPGYYKVDLVYKDEEAHILKYYNIIRNFEYAVTIDNVEAPGTTKDKAMKEPARNNLSASVATKNLLNISDGTGRLFVSFTDTTLVNTDKVYLKYRYVPDIKDYDTDANSKVWVSPLEGNVISSGTNNSSTTDSKGYSYIEILPNTPERVTKTQTVILAVGELSREVHFTLAKLDELELSCTPVVEQSLNASVDVELTIPSNLPEKYFPLEFQIEASKSSLYPDSEWDYMPVRTGISITDSGKQTFYFIKTVTYNDYRTNGGTIVCHFKTNIEESASDIYVFNKYFGLNKTSFTNSGAPAVEYKTISIKKENLRAEGVYSSYCTPVSIYTDSGYLAMIDGVSCSFTWTRNVYQLADNLEFKVPTTVQTLYFRCMYGPTYLTASISVSDLESNTRKALTFKYE